jgi:hypothetical protein
MAPRVYSATGTALAANALVTVTRRAQTASVRMGDSEPAP